MHIISSMNSEKNINLQIEMEMKAKEIFDLLEQPDELHENNIDITDKSFVPVKIQNFQAKPATIQYEAIFSSECNDFYSRIVFKISNVHGALQKFFSPALTEHI